MEPNVWGPSAWELFHNLAEQTDKKEIICEFFKFHVANLIPCGTCRENYRNHLLKLPCEEVNISNWLKKFHNIVNKQNNKPIFRSKIIIKPIELNTPFINGIAATHKGSKITKEEIDALKMLWTILDKPVDNKILKSRLNYIKWVHTVVNRQDSLKNYKIYLKALLLL